MGGGSEQGSRGYPRDNEMRIVERDGKRWLQQWQVSPDGPDTDRRWVDVAELKTPAPRVHDVVNRSTTFEWLPNAFRKT
jgi:hypothetical protein